MNCKIKLQRAAVDRLTNFTSEFHLALMLTWTEKLSNAKATQIHLHEHRSIKCIFKSSVFSTLSLPPPHISRVKFLFTGSQQRQDFRGVLNYSLNSHLSPFHSPPSLNCLRINFPELSPIWLKFSDIWLMSDILLKEEFSSCDGDRPVCWVDQVIDTLTVLRGQHLICTTVKTNKKRQSTLVQK